MGIPHVRVSVTCGQVSLTDFLRSHLKKVQPMTFVCAAFSEFIARLQIRKRLFRECSGPILVRGWHYRTLF